MKLFKNILFSKQNSIWMWKLAKLRHSQKDASLLKYSLAAEEFARRCCYDVIFLWAKKCREAKASSMGKDCPNNLGSSTSLSFSWLLCFHQSPSRISNPLTLQIGRTKKTDQSRNAKRQTRNIWRVSWACFTLIFVSSFSLKSMFYASGCCQI